VLFNDVSVRKEHEAHLRLMVDELNHRVKNTLAVVQAIAQQTFKRDDIEISARRAFEGRLIALAQAHNLLTQSHWEKAALEDVAVVITNRCGSRDGSFHIEGPKVDLQVHQAVPIAMALHELCTNAIKYGSLSNDSGTVYLTWQVSPGSPSMLRIEWREQGGPPVQPPARKGFGSKRVEGALAQELSGQAKIEFNPEGVRCVIEGPLQTAVPVS
jgi:two-component sensor histidine kinase